MVCLNQIGVEANDSPVFCTLLGTVIFIKWMELLFEFSQFKHVGMHVLPIVDTMQEVGPFSAVVGVCIIASSNLYYAFGQYDAFDSFMLMYRLAVLGDADLNQLENAGGGCSGGGKRSLLDSQADTGDYYFVTRVLFCLVSFTISITLMNLYIGVLTIYYQKHSTTAVSSFWRFRVSSAVEAQAILGGWNAMTRVMLRRPGRNRCSDASTQLGARLTHCASKLNRNSTSQTNLEVPTGCVESTNTFTQSTESCKQTATSSFSNAKVLNALTAAEEGDANDMFMWVCVGCETRAEDL